MFCSFYFAFIGNVNVEKLIFQFQICFLNCEENLIMELIEVNVGDIHNVEDQKAMLQMLDLYMQDPMGASNKLQTEIAVKNIEGLTKQANYVFFLAKCNGETAGVANCFVNFSTFKAKQLINIHDFAVDPKFRRKGIGEAMMKKIISYSSEHDFCKVTLEVRNDNQGAQNLYKKVGFKECDPIYHFWEMLVWKYSNEELKPSLGKSYKPKNIAGNSSAIQDVYNLVGLVSKTNLSVLFRGESGIGKELFADSIHSSSLRENMLFVKVDCSVVVG